MNIRSKQVIWIQWNIHIYKNIIEFIIKKFNK